MDLADQQRPTFIGSMHTWCSLEDLLETMIHRDGGDMRRLIQVKD